MTASLLFACAVCAQQPRAGSTWLLVLAFLAVPFVVAAVIIHAVRRVDS